MIAKVGQGLSQIVFNGLGQAFASRLSHKKSREL
jgi:hypothetical protein